MKNYKLIIYFLALGATVVGTAESIITGILDMLASDIQVSIGLAGQLVTVYSIGYAVGTPILIAFTSRVDRKKLLLAALCTFVIGNIVAVISPNFALLMISRAVLGVSAGVFAVVALGVAAQMAPPEKRGSAIGTVLMGTSLALVVGLPLGTLIGEYMGWRWIFAILGLVTVVTIAAIAKAVPKLSGQEAVPLSKQLAVLKEFKVISGLLTSLLFITGYSVVSTYLAPLLRENAGLNTNTISLVLLGMGLMAVVGARVGGYGADKWGIARTLIVSLLLHVIALFFLPVAAVTFVGSLFIVALWMLGAWTTAPAQQFYLVTMAPQSTDIILSLNSSAFHLGVAVGATLGGVIVENLPLSSIGWVGGLVVLLATVFAVISIVLNSKQKAVTEQFKSL
ncbi:MFS transporter [Paenibacillus radicis (ex Gao et al. 2016)]|uniref:MFS-type transporter YbcL n=1 Tax=Paenibacillus radicis (ex Gao et al. 2016) TaxID=1737354 RepID=A0A917H7G6_9BACL|nr:MFS transporter [Paenibacillus radicis (ex Gao et al. 2016)]GGG69979.1 putative MFS-type transporter YbcL [Paenibacillus radicis (ex Gao et al. 2016)]